MNKEHTYYVKGMHCASCEVLIEKKLLKIPNIKSVDASTVNNQVTVEYENEKPNIEHLNKVFKKDNYTFFENEHKSKQESQAQKNNIANPTLFGFCISVTIFALFLLLDRMGIASILNVNSSSSIFAFFGFGLLAGLSSCAALVGGIVLSMSKQWSRLYDDNQGNYKKLEPHVMFNVGRVLSYTLLGGVLGLLGSQLKISIGFTSFLVIAVSLLMIGFGLQMLGIRSFRKFQFALPKSITRKIADENKFQGKYMPFVMGALTFFLPCGFTLTAQGIALLSSSPVQGALIMGAFALGTAPMLLFIGYSSVKSLSKQHLAEKFSKAAGFLVMFFALFTLNNQMNVFGFGFSDVFTFNAGNEQGQNKDINGLAPIVDGKQLLQMTVFAASYSTNYFKVRAGVPVRWEMTSSGSPGCGSGVLVANGLFGPVYLSPDKGAVTVKEFTPQNPGKYKFSCPMGMVRGSIEVVN